MSVRRSAPGAAALAAAALVLAPLAALAQPPAPRPAPAAPAVAAPAADSAAPAFTTVTGAVYDSVAAGPLAGALVQLVRGDDPSVNRAGTTDSTGRFRIDSVAAGRYLIGFIHPRLDALQLDPPLGALDVAGERLEVAMAIPAPAQLVAARCPVSGDGPSGMVIGRVRDADSAVAAGGATVVVSWSERLFERTGMRTQLRAVNTTADAEGRFLVCGVPTDAELRARASAEGGRRSGDVPIQLGDGGFLQRDLLVVLPGAERRGTARVAGRVRSREGAPLPNAQVIVSGAGTVTGSAGSAGAFAFDTLPPGTVTVEARAVGFTPNRVSVDVENGRTTTADIVLDPLPPVLDTIAVETRSNSDAAQFRARARRGFGHFITPEEVERRRVTQVTDLLRTVPSMQVIPTGSRSARIRIRNCSPAVYVDGMVVADGAADINALVASSEVGAMEVYASGRDAPPEYQRGACGVVLIWTKGRIAP